MRARALLGHISRAWTCGRISPEQTLCIILRHPGACTSRLPFHAGYAVIGRVRSMSSGSGQSASSAEGAGKWGAPGSKRMRKRAKDSFDGGPLKVTADDEAEWLAICEELKSKAKSLGLGPTAITTSDPSSRIKEFEKWIENGYHGDMGFLAREDRMARRRNLAEILPNVKAVIVTSLVYWPGEKGFPAEQSSETHGNVSCYAWGSDYHEILGNKLKELASWLHERAGGAGRWYVDTGAIMERDLGERAGIGFVGKNSLLIAPGLGSGFFLGEILTTLPLPIDAAKKSRAGCGKCTRCLDACPTDAFVGPYVLDARKCISYLTIEHKGHIPRQLRPAFGNRIYGCDVCQQVCPWNSSAYKGVSRKGSPLFGPVPVAVAAPELAELLALDEEAFAKRFSGSPISRIGLARLVRNAAVAADPALLGAVVTALASWEGKDAMVSEHLEWARNRLAESR